VLCVVRFEVSATGQSLVQRSPTERDVSEWDGEALAVRRLRPAEGCCGHGERKEHIYIYIHFSEKWMRRLEGAEYPPQFPDIVLYTYTCKVM